MLQVKSSKLFYYLRYLDKSLTTTLKKDSKFTIQSTNNGLDCSIITEEYTNTYTVSDLADEDGHITLDFNDLVSVIDNSGVINLDEVDDTIVMVNGFPVFKLDYTSPNHVNIKDDTARLSKKDTNLLIDELKSYRSELKKSIFEESSWALVSLYDETINIRVVNPIRYKSSEVKIDGIQPRLELFINKQRLKLLEILFKNSDIILSRNYIESDDYKLTFESFPLNKNLYFPDKYVAKSYY